MSVGFLQIALLTQLSGRPLLWDDPAVLVAAFDSVRGWADRYSSVWELGVAVRTLALAAVTYVLARRASRAERTALEALGLQRQQFEGSQRRIVYPVVPRPGVAPRISGAAASS